MSVCLMLKIVLLLYLYFVWLCEVMFGSTLKSKSKSGANATSRRGHR